MKDFINQILEALTLLVAKIVDFFKTKPQWFTPRKLIIAGSIVVAIIVTSYSLLNWYKTKDLSASLQVSVAEVDKQVVPVYLTYVSLTESIKNVDIRARVKGFLTQRNFKEGADVNDGDLMFVIDPREYEAALEQSIGQLEKDQASYEFAVLEVERYTPLVEKDYVTREQYDKIVTQMKEAQATLESSKARVEQSKLNLSYCKMYSPLNGRVGKTFVHVGNLVGAGEETKLATIVQLDPIYAYFSPSEEELRAILEYKQKGELPAFITFPDGTEYEHLGKMDFIDNIVNSETSTIKMRTIIPNPDKRLLPGTYVNTHLYLTESPNTLIIPQEAVIQDQAGSYVYVVNDKHIVEFRRITIGQSKFGIQIVKEGLKKGEKVITKGLQLVKAGMEVTEKIEPIDYSNVPEKYKEPAKKEEQAIDNTNETNNSANNTTETKNKTD